MENNFPSTRCVYMFERKFAFSYTGAFDVIIIMHRAFPTDICSLFYEEEGNNNNNNNIV